MAVVGMHKLMGPLMTNAAGTGGVRIVLAANQLGEAIEHEVRIQKFLGKTKKKPDAELESVTNKQEQVIKNQEKLIRRVTQLMKKQKVHQVRRIVKFHDNTKPWGQEAHVKTISSENQPVRWVTPLGLPVVQPYWKLGRHLIKTSLQALTLQQETDKVMVKQQKTAFPPNFVCSLDGSHMMMTAVACKNANLNFAGVHDSYWTRACDVDQMNRVLRENFVELYYTPILENLLESFHKSFPNLHFPPLPERGDFDLREVLESTYFFN